LDFKSSPVIVKAVEIAQKLNLRIFLVGGPLRDIFLGKKVLDFDLAISGQVKAFGEKLAQALKGRFIYHPQFLTGKILYADQYVDIAQLRDESYEKPGALPKVKPIADIETDLKRRDFTINAFAYDLLADKIIDPFCGLKDLKEKKIRILHENSFFDDPTRIFRAIRFAKRFNFEIEKKTFILLKKAIKESYLKTISYQRIFHELNLILKEKNFKAMLHQLSRLGVFKKIFLKSLSLKEISQLAKLKKARLAEDLIFAYLLFLLNFKEKKFLKKEIIKIIEDLNSFKKIKRKLLKVKKLSKIYLLLSPFSLNSLKIISLLEPALKAKIKNYQKSKDKKPFINGEELKALIKRGIIKNLKAKDFSQILLYLKLKKIDGKLKNKEEELKAIIKWTQEH
jgi:tRNA nucleotidyltransferase/poly(A) polymerase